jgi:uncharacterized protein (DUF4415 family)
MNGKKRSTATESVSPDDAPELTDAFFEQADEYRGDKLVRRGRGRPPSAARKVLLSVRYSPEVVEYFRATGEGWQARMDEALREYVTRHRAA